MDSFFSVLNKKIVVENRRINQLLSSKNKTKLDGISLELENLIGEVSHLRNELDIIKDKNHQKNNINRVKINYIKEAIFSGLYEYKGNNIILDVYDLSNHKKVFNLVMYYDLLEMILTNKNYINKRIELYEKAPI